MSEMYKEMLFTAENAGLKVISDSLCCKLLAVAYFFTNEDVVFNEKLHTDVLVAAKRLGFYGGGKPNTELAREIRRLVKELRLERPDWLCEIEERYNTHFLEESGLYPVGGEKHEDIRLHKSINRYADSGKPEKCD